MKRIIYLAVKVIEHYECKTANEYGYKCVHTLQDNILYVRIVLDETV